MGLLGNIVAKSVSTIARNSTIKAVGNAVSDVVSAVAKNHECKDDAVVKNGTLYIKPTRSSEEYLGKSVLAVARELLGAGFESVSLQSVKKLGKFSAKKYGEIASITINGQENFSGLKRVPTSSFVLVEFLDFKDNFDRQSQGGLPHIKSGSFRSVSEIEEMLD